MRQSVSLKKVTPKFVKLSLNARKCFQNGLFPYFAADPKKSTKMIQNISRNGSFILFATTLVNTYIDNVEVI